MIYLDKIRIKYKQEFANPNTLTLFVTNFKLGYFLLLMLGTNCWAWALNAFWQQKRCMREKV